MTRNYDRFNLDAELPGIVELQIRKVVDAILDGGYDVMDREHLAILIAADMQIVHYRTVRAMCEEQIKANRKLAAEIAKGHNTGKERP